MIALLAGGCTQSSGFPETTAASPLGNPSRCAACEESIAEVKPDNLITLRGIQYTVCDPRCAKRAETLVAEEKL